MSSFVISPAGLSLPIASINKVLGRVIAWILVPVCTFLLSDIFWKIYYPDTISLQQSGDIGTQLAVRGQAGNTSTSWEWFKLREPPKPKPVQIARIQADLIGIVGLGESGTAMINVENKGPKIYAVGDEIKEGIFLSRLGNDHVILLRGETEEKLAIKKANNLFTESQPQAEALASAESVPIVRRNDNVIEVIKENPLKIGEMVKFERVNAGRYGEGIKIEPGMSSEYDLFTQLNLNPGDIVLGIAKQRITDIMDNPSSIRGIMNEKEVRIQYVRAGKLESTVVKIN